MPTPSVPWWASRHLTAPLTAGAFATRGQWESAWHLQRDALPDREQVADYAARAGGELAFEAFSGSAFFGLRVEGEAAQIASFASAAVDALRTARNACDVVAALVEQGWIDVDAPLRFAEIGAVFAWKSVGPFRLETPAQALAQRDAWWPAFERSALFHETAHAKALELAFDRHVPHWCGLPLLPAGDARDQWAGVLERELRALATAG